MSNLPPVKRSKLFRRRPDFEIEEDDENVNVIMIPNLDDSQDSDSDSDSGDNDQEIDSSPFNQGIMPTTSCHQVLESYSDNQKK